MNFIATIADFVKNFGVTIIIILGIIVVTIYIFSYLHRFFQYLRAQKYHLINDTILEFIEIGIEYTLGIFVVIGIFYMLSTVSNFAKIYLWEVTTPLLFPFFVIFLLILFAEIITSALSRLFKYLRGDLKIKPKNLLTPKVSYFADMLIKYTVYIVTFFIALIILLSALKMLGNISQKISVFFSNNVDGFLWIVFVILIGFVIYKFLIELIKDVKLRSVKEKERLEKNLKMVIRFTIFIIDLVVVLTIILLMLGISNVNYLIISIVMFTIIISALIFLTTPLKNWISGIILMYSGAFLENDNIQIGDKISGKVIEIDTLFTKILNEETMIELIPNSLILSNKIAIKSSVFTNIPIILDFTVNFEVSHEKVEELVMDAVNDTENILDIQPRPSINAVKFENNKIVYELKVYIENIDKKEEVISKLIFKIQDKFLAEKIIIGI